MDYSFKIINSSAGSGKTFNLATEYISKLLNSQDDEHFKSMLALTFTNKASIEMKDRILIYLFDLKHKRNKIIQEIISIKTGLDQLTIEKKSSNILESDHNGKPIFEKPITDFVERPNEVSNKKFEITTLTSHSKMDPIKQTKYENRINRIWENRKSSCQCDFAK